MDAQQQLFGLMAVAEEHQKAVNAALERLAAERVALAQERAAVAQAAASVAGAAGEVRKAAAEALPAIQKAAGEAVGASVRQSLAGASEAAAKALSEASSPIVGQLSGVVKAASQAEGQLSGAVAAFGWRWAMLAASTAAGGIVALMLAAWLTVWWQRYQVEQLTEKRQALAEEVARLQATVSDLEKRGGRVTLATCGGRLCIEASPNQGKGAENWAGAWWKMYSTGVPFVIPKGY